MLSSVSLTFAVGFFRWRRSIQPDENDKLKTQKKTTSFHTSNNWNIMGLLEVWMQFLPIIGNTHWHHEMTTLFWFWLHHVWQPNPDLHNLILANTIQWLLLQSRISSAEKLPTCHGRLKKYWRPSVLPSAPLGDFLLELLGSQDFQKLHLWPWGYGYWDL